MRARAQCELAVPIFREELFTVASPGNMCSEASDLQFRGASRLWNDAADEGIEIKGKWESTRFVLRERVRRDGELLAWIFEPVDALGVIRRVTIFND